MSANFCLYQPPSSPCPHMSSFQLTTPFLCPYRRRVGRLIKELKRLWKNKSSFKETCILYIFLSCLFIFHSSKQQSQKITSKCPRLSSRDHNEKDVHLQLLPLPPTVTFARIVANPFPPPRCGHSLWMPPNIK